MFDGMFERQLTLQQWLMVFAAFGLVLSVWCLVLLLISLRRKAHDRRIAQRLGLGGTETEGARVLRLWNDNQDATTVVPGTSSMEQWITQLKAMPQEMGWNVPLRSIVLGLAGVMSLMFASALAYTGNLIVALAACGVTVAMFVAFCKHMTVKYAAKFERQFVEALTLVARSLRAGHPLGGAFRLAAEEMQEPVSEVFLQICQEQSLGVSIETALQNVSERSNSSDVRLFATSIGIQFRSGGNLAAMMERLADVIRDRIRLSQRVRVVSAQVQLSKRILLALPIIMFLLLSVINPKHMEPLYTSTTGHYMLFGGAVAMALGWWCMNKMTDLKY